MLAEEESSGIQTAFEVADATQAKVCELSYLLSRSVWVEYVGNKGRLTYTS